MDDINKKINANQARMDNKHFTSYILEVSKI